MTSDPGTVGSGPVTWSCFCIVGVGSEEMLVSPSDLLGTLVAMGVGDIESASVAIPNQRKDLIDEVRLCRSYGRSQHNFGHRRGYRVSK